MKKQKIIVIDGNALLHRAFHAIPPTLTTKDGQMVNAVYGFTSILLRVFKDLKPNYWVLTFDKATPTFRHKEYKEYKAQRKKQPQELYDQLSLCKKVVEVFGIPIYEKDGFEADDVIGTIATQIKSNASDLETIIVTGDLDTLQLVNDTTKVFTLKKGINDTIIYDEKTAKERFGGLAPDQLIDFKALRGDPSDNIPGVKGIGEKGAIDLLTEFENIENLYENIDSEKIKDSVRAKLKERKDDAFLSKKLATILLDVPVEFNLEDAKVRLANKDNIVALFQSLEFQSLMNKIPPELMATAQPSLFDVGNGRDALQCVSATKMNEKYHLIKSEKEYNDFLKILEKQKEIILDSETTGLNPREAKIVGLSFCFEEGGAYYLEFGMVTDKLKNILQDQNIKKIGHNIKYDYSMLKANGIEVKGIYFDTMIASYVINPGRPSGLDALSFSEFGHQKITTEQVLGNLTSEYKIVKKSSYLPMDKIAPERLSQYACEDVDYTFRLYKKFVQQIKESDLEELFYKIEMPLVIVLAEMELDGVKIDVKLLDKLSKEIDERLKNTDRQIYKYASVDFNINSPIQLKDVLFNKLKISTLGLSKTKTGISTAAGELEKMKDLHPIIDLISQHRELAKLNSTYVDVLPNLISKKTGRVHTSFNQTVTATGRLSSSNPNLQNIPIRTELGEKIRHAFIAEKGCKLISADYSQIELRIIASLANDQKMLKAFADGKDIHTATAAVINEVDLEYVTKEMRSAAKEVNFGVIYGMGAYGLSLRTGIEVRKAREFIDKYFSIYSDIKKYLDDLKTNARENGYVETFFGRRRYLPEINSQVAVVRNAAERMAINMPIQGTAADLMKIAMIAVYKMIKEINNNDVKLTLQVHDELVLEVKESIADDVAKKVKDIMENVHLSHNQKTKDKFTAPIKVEVKIGDSWGECK
ncbi:MAG: DNA polymerase I [bacterium]